MDRSLFAFDYSYVNRLGAFDRPISNPSELLRSDDLQGLLRLCGMRECEINALASDYEYFSALCRSYPMLAGHPVKNALKAFFQAYFPSAEEPNGENAHTIWKMTINDLEEHPRKLSDFLPQNSRALIPWDRLFEISDKLEPMPDLNSLLTLSYTDFSSWRSTLNGVFEAFQQRGCCQILMTLPSEFRFFKPDPYHVSLALAASTRTDEQNSLILSQLFREACEQKLPILFYADCDPMSATALLNYAEHTVGLPALIWASRRSDTRDAMLAWQSLEHTCEISMALRLSLLPSDEECASAIRLAAARYPVDRLCLISESDLILMRFARERLERIWKETRKKL